MNRLVEILDAFAGKKVLVLGDFMLDEYVKGKVERISPEAPVPVVEARGISHKPGGAGNVTLNLSALGAKPFAFGVIGRDEAGRKLKAMLEQAGVDASMLLVQENRPTTRKMRIIAGAQQLLRVDWENTDYIDTATFEKLRDVLVSVWREFDAMIISDYGKGVVTESLFELTRKFRAQIPVALDPKERNFGFYKDVTTMTPNIRETYLAVGIKPVTDSDAEKAGRRLIERFNLNYAVVTRAEKGLSVVCTDRVSHIPARAKQVFDVTGAGDTVISVFTLSVACGATPEEAGELANTAGGIVVGKVGTATVTVEEIRHELLHGATDAVQNVQE